jgi:hypothetical protein
MVISQEPIFIGGTGSINFWPIFPAYVREYPNKIWPYMIQYLHFRIPKFSLRNGWEIDGKTMGSYIGNIGTSRNMWESYGKIYGTVPK